MKLNEEQLHRVLARNQPRADLIAILVKKGRNLEGQQGLPTLSAVDREKAPGQIECPALGVLLNRSTPEQAAQWLREAFEAGVTHFDVAPEYGSAEERMGPALEPYRRTMPLSGRKWSMLRG